MARDQSSVTRTERNGALVEVMLLACMADGPPTDVGMQARAITLISPSFQQ